MGAFMKKNIIRILTLGLLLTQSNLFCMENDGARSIARPRRSSSLELEPALRTLSPAPVKRTIDLERNRVLVVPVHDQLTILRNRRTNIAGFRRANGFVAGTLAQAAARNLQLIRKNVQTPTDSIALGYEHTNDLIFVSILRSAEALVPTFMDRFPNAGIGHLGLERKENRDGTIYKKYYEKLPPFQKANAPFISCVVLDPMLATGGSMCGAINVLKTKGIAEKNIMIVCVISAPEGILRLREEFPELGIIITCAVDEKLNDTFYIIPGLGDYGDRYFGTQCGVSGVVWDLEEEEEEEGENQVVTED